MKYRVEKEAGRVAAGLGGGGEGLASETNVCLCPIPSGSHQTDYNAPPQFLKTRIVLTFLHQQVMRNTGHYLTAAAASREGGWYSGGWKCHHALSPNSSCPGSWKLHIQFQSPKMVDSVHLCQFVGGFNGGTNSLRFYSTIFCDVTLSSQTSFICWLIQCYSKWDFWTSASLQNVTCQS